MNVTIPTIRVLRVGSNRSTRELGRPAKSPCAIESGLGIPRSVTSTYGECGGIDPAAENRQKMLANPIQLARLSFC
jgi:hypothetical protein